MKEEREKGMRGRVEKRNNILESEAINANDPRAERARCLVSVRWHSVWLESGKETQHGVL